MFYYTIPNVNNYLLLSVFEKRENLQPTDIYAVLLKMQHWCAYQERCQQDARYKLYELGLWKEAVEQIISTLIETNFINEERFATQFVHGKFSIKKWGRVKIKAELKQKNISDYCVKKAMQQINEQEYISVLTKLMSNKRKLITENNPIKRNHKLLNYAASKGYEKEIIMNVLHTDEH